MGDVGGSQTTRDALDASQYAPRASQHQAGHQPNPPNHPSALWHTLIDTLLDAEVALKKEEEDGGRATARPAVNKAIALAREIWVKDTRKGDAEESRLSRIKRSLERLLNQNTDINKGKT